MARVHFLGRRIHHGMVGCVLCVLGFGLAYHDRRDCRSWWPGRR